MRTPRGSALKMVLRGPPQAQEVAKTQNQTQAQNRNLHVILFRNSPSSFLSSPWRKPGLPSQPVPPRSPGIFAFKWTVKACPEIVADEYNHYCAFDRRQDTWDRRHLQYMAALQETHGAVIRHPSCDPEFHPEPRHLIFTQAGFVCTPLIFLNFTAIFS